jgi:hypothetical protein
LSIDEGGSVFNTKDEERIELVLPFTRYLIYKQGFWFEEESLVYTHSYGIVVVFRLREKRKKGQSFYFFFILGVYVYIRLVLDLFYQYAIVTNHFTYKLSQTLFPHSRLFISINS